MALDDGRSRRCARRRVAVAAAPAWIDDDTLVAQGVTPWTGLPLWLPPSEPDSARLHDDGLLAGAEAGLAIRPLADTIRDTAAWLATRDNAGAGRTC